MEKVRKTKNYIVIFQQEDGSVLKTSFVAHGKSAVPPGVPEKKGESAHYEVRFAGWDKSFDSVHENLVVKAIYKEVPKKYLVMFFHENGKLLGMETVPYGTAAKADIIPEKKGNLKYDYIFEGWNCDLSVISSDTMARAVFREQKKSFTVCFYGDDHRLLQKEMVLYGEAAKEPEPVEKAEDKTFRYFFKKWSKNTTCVTGPMEIYAEYEAVFKEYEVSFFEEEEWIESRMYHYGEPIQYPKRVKKGYELIWSRHPEIVEESTSIKMTWKFTNDKNKIIAKDGNIFCVRNPSVKNGEVSCLKYVARKETHVTIPPVIKLGEYYYKITKIEKEAFVDCVCMEVLILPDTVKSIEEGAISRCRHLKKVVFGTGLSFIGKNAFAFDEKLKEIWIRGRGLRFVDKKALEQRCGVLKVKVKPERKMQYQKLFREQLARGKMELE